MVYKSSSLWPGIKQFYSTILDNTSSRLLVQVLLLISGMINGVLLLL